MTERNIICKQIRNLTYLLINNSFSINQNLPKYKNNKVIWVNYKKTAFSLKNEPYEIIYNNCIANKDYNFMLLDGALIQMQYEFNRNKLIGHILGFYPNPDFEKFQDNPKEYEDLYYGNELFTSILEKKIITFPIRFDYSSEHIDTVHPKIHASFGNYTDCRIPISKPLSPNRFVSFILRNFYYYKFNETKLSTKISYNLSFDTHITNNEKELLHLNYE